MTPSQLAALLPCPFCGGCPLVHDNAVPVKISCGNRNCILGNGTKMQDGLGQGIFWYKAKYFSADEWNTRAAQPSLPELRDKLVEQCKAAVPYFGELGPGPETAAYMDGLDIAINIITSGFAPYVKGD